MSDHTGGIISSPVVAQAVLPATDSTALPAWRSPGSWVWHGSGTASSPGAVPRARTSVPVAEPGVRMVLEIDTSRCRGCRGGADRYRIGGDAAPEGRPRGRPARRGGTPPDAAGGDRLVRPAAARARTGAAGPAGGLRRRRHPGGGRDGLRRGRYRPGRGAGAAGGPGGTVAGGRRRPRPGEPLPAAGDHPPIRRGTPRGSWGDRAVARPARQLLRGPAVAGPRPRPRSSRGDTLGGPDQRRAGQPARSVVLGDRHRQRRHRV